MYIHVHIHVQQMYIVQTCSKFKWQNDIGFELNVKANIAIILSLKQYKPCIPLTR